MSSAPRRFSGDWEDLLAVNAASMPDNVAFRFLDRGVLREQYTYSELLVRVDFLAAWLQQRFVPGDRLVLLFAPGLAFVEAFLGCTRAGLIPVPLSPSLGRHQYASLHPFLVNCSAVAVLGPRMLWHRQIDLINRSAPSCQTRWLDWHNVQSEAHAMRGFRRPAFQGGIAFLQYTSGSTGFPKGVIVGQSNLLHNLAQLAEACRVDDRSIFLGWIPHFHDMGLIGIILQALYLGRPAILMNPQEFVRRPFSWLEAVSLFEATVTFAPSSALDLCIRVAKLQPAAQFDLSCLRCLVCGSEPIHVSTLDAFLTLFGNYGLAQDSIYCGYGLAEATLIVSGSRFHGAAEPCDTLDPANCGISIIDQAIKIVGPETFGELPDGQEGLIMVKGPSINRGYWKPRGTAGEVFDNVISGEPGYLNTGDIGRLCKGELTVTGRLKDLIIVSGRNIYPQDLERAALVVCPDLKLWRCLAFDIVDHEKAGQLILLVEQERGAICVELEASLRRIGAEISRGFGITVAEVLLLPLNSLPRTTSGKLRRQEARRLHQLGKFDHVISRTRANQLMPKVSVATPGSILMMIKRIMARLTGLDPLGIEADHLFNDFALGSLQLAELKLELDQLLEADLPLEAFLADLTLRQLADNLFGVVASITKPVSFGTSSNGESRDEPCMLDDTPSLRRLMVSGLPDHLCKLQKQHGDLVAFRWGRQVIHLLSDPVEVQSLMQRPEHEFIRGKVFEGMRMATDGHNLFTTVGHTWRQERQRAQPLFTRQAVEAVAADFAPIARHCLQRELVASGEPELDLDKLSKSITIEIALHHLFGEIYAPMKEQLTVALKELTGWHLPRHFLAQVDQLQAGSSGSVSAKCGLILDAVVFAAIEAQLAGRQPSNCLLAAYLADDKVMAMPTDERRSYLRSAMYSLLIAGLETSVSSLYFSLDLLSRHPEYQRRAREEVRAAALDGEIGSDNLPVRLPYTMAVVHETLRLFPPVWFFGREAVAATKIMGEPISQGDIVLTSPYVIHRHPDHWHDPHVFQPERFLKKPGGAAGNLLYLPFGGGPQTCVGRWLALYQITLALGALLERHELSSDGEERPTLSSYSTLKTIKSITLRVEACG